MAATHPAWRMSGKAADGALPWQSAALASLPPRGRPPVIASTRRRPAAGAGGETAGFATFPLASAAGSPGTARSLTRSTLRDWGMAELADDVTVVVSELVTNALRYGLAGTGPRQPLPPATAEQPILLSLVHYGRSVLCAVFDPGAEVPRVKEPDFFQESGRGLHVLASLAESWGWTTPDRHGKAVWALLPAPDRTGDRSGDEQHGEEPQGEEPQGCRQTPPGRLADAEWDPLTRLLLLLELLSGPSWLKALGSWARGVTPGPGPARP